MKWEQFVPSWGEKKAKRVASRLRARRSGRVVSPFGWPVPEEARCVDTDTLRWLISEAQSSGFSRTGERIDIDSRETTRYILVPILPESSPTQSWICILLAYDPSLLGGKHSPLRRIPHRLDVAPPAYEGLNLLSEKEKDQLLHALIWAFTIKSADPSPQ